MAKDRKTRGRSSITFKGKSPALPQASTRSDVESVRRVEANRPVKAGSGKHRGDRRDMNKTYTGNRKHAARGNTPRANVATRKD